MLIFHQTIPEIVKVMKRKFPILNNQAYHVYTKSIYKYVIFPTDKEFQYMRHLFEYYQMIHPCDHPSFSIFLKSYAVKTLGLKTAMAQQEKSLRLVSIPAWCLMPTHIHLILRQESDNGIKEFMRRILGGYSQFFNKRHNRHGPLWQSRFGASLIHSDRQLKEKIHYVLNNPVKDLGYKKPEDWPYSSLFNPRD